jgi:hypothetical protein
MAEQIELLGNIGVGPRPDGKVALVIDVGGGRVYSMTLEPEAAESVGKALLAPNVALPGNGQVH